MEELKSVGRGMVDALRQAYMDAMEKVVPAYQQLSPAAQRVFDEVSICMQIILKKLLNF
jgi:hypothetical protein